MASVSVYGGNNQALVLCVPSSTSGNQGPISLPNRALPYNGPRSIRLRRLIGTAEAAALVPTWGTTVPTRGLRIS